MQQLQLVAFLKVLSNFEEYSDLFNGLGQIKFKSCEKVNLNMT